MSDDKQVEVQQVEVPEGYVLFEGVLYKQETFTGRVAYKMWQSRARRKKLTYLFRKQKGVCACCGCQMARAKNRGARNEPHYATVEHVVPQSKGGKDFLSNLLATCHACNSKRGVIDFEEFCRIRRDPELWANFRKQVSREKAQRDLERQEKRGVKQEEMTVKLAVLAFLFPDFSAMLNGCVEVCHA